MESIIDEEYLSNFPLEEVASHLKSSLKLLENAEMQWMSEKEALLREIERLRLENRKLRIEVRNNENFERSVSDTALNSYNHLNNYLVINQENKDLIPILSSSSHQKIINTINNNENLLDMKNLANNNNLNINRNSNSNSRYLLNENITTPNSQNCRVRKIKLEDQSDDDKNRKNSTIKYREVGKSIGKNSRNNLQAFECTECSKFYKAINNNKLNQTLCKHMKQSSLLQNSGKHRYNHPPTKSPPGYWDLDDI